MTQRRTNQWKFSCQMSRCIRRGLQRRHHPGVHQPEASSRHIDFAFLEEGGFLSPSLIGQLITFEGLKPFKAMLVEDDHQADPHQTTGKYVKAGDLE